MSGTKPNLDGYVEVKDRIALFYAKHPEGRLVTAEVIPSTEPDGVARIWVHGQAFRTADDPHPADGWSWMALPGSTSFTRGSEIENTETSAWGRAIGALGIGIEKSIGSRDEIDGKGGEADRVYTPRPTADEPEDNEPALIPLGTETHTGKVTKGSGQSNDCVYHAHPSGFRFGFRLAFPDGKALPQVVCNGPLGLALHGLVGEDIVGQEVTVTGEAFRVEQTGRRAYRRLVVAAIRGDGFAYPPDEASDAEPPFSVAPGTSDSDLDKLAW